jgi:Mn-dependent DtxR family transcriptional regulator
MKTKIYIVASTNIESTKAFTNKLLAQDYRDELQESERRDKVTITEQEIDVPFATDRRKYGMTLKEIRDEIADFTGDKKGEAMRKAKIFAHNISIAHVCRLRLSFGHRTDEHGNRTEDHNWLQIQWTDQDGDSDTFSIIE